MDTLPLDLFKYIIDYLDLKNIMVYTLVNKQTNERLNNHFKIIYYMAKQFKTIIYYFKPGYFYYGYNETLDDIISDRSAKPVYDYNILFVFCKLMVHKSDYKCNAESTMKIYGRLYKVSSTRGHLYEFFLMSKDIEFSPYTYVINTLKLKSI
jgi:hypothetical protein